MTTVAEIVSGIGGANKNSVTVRGNTACDIDIEIKAAKENKFGTDPIFSSERENEASNLSEIIDPLEVFDEKDITESTNNSMTGAEFKSSYVRTDLTSLEVDTPRTTDNSVKVESNDKYGSYSPSRLYSKRRITFSSGNNTSDPEKAEEIETVEEEDDLGRWLSRAEDDSFLLDKSSTSTTSPLITECDQCDLIIASNVSQEFLSLEFSE